MRPLLHQSVCVMKMRVVKDDEGEGEKERGAEVIKGG
jgi:hypothetical protein